MESTYRIMRWCDDQNEHVKKLQDVCLDHPLDEESKNILRNLVKVQNELKDLYEECEAKNLNDYER